MPDDRLRKTKLQFVEEEQAEPAVRKPGRKMTRALSQQDSAPTRSRLQLTKAELGDPNLEKPLRKADMAPEKLVKSKARMPKHKAMAIARATDEATGKTKIKLLFEEKAKPPSRLMHEVLPSPAGEIHRQISKLIAFRDYQHTHIIGSASSTSRPWSQLRFFVRIRF